MEEGNLLWPKGRFWLIAEAKSQAQGAGTAVQPQGPCWSQAASWEQGTGLAVDKGCGEGFPGPRLPFGWLVAALQQHEKSEEGF